MNEREEGEQKRVQFSSAPGRHHAEFIVLSRSLSAAYAAVRSVHAISFYVILYTCSVNCTPRSVRVRKIARSDIFYNLINNKLHGHAWFQVINQVPASWTLLRANKCRAK